MTRSYLRIVFVILSIPATSCAFQAKQTVPNTERGAFFWRSTERNTMCLEYATPADKMRSQQAAASIESQTYGGAKLSYESAESLAQIYTVSEIMQFGHAALYRLCEAQSNGFFGEPCRPDDKRKACTEGDRSMYQALFKETLDGMKELIRLQLQVTDNGPYARLEAKRKVVERLEEQRLAEEKKQPVDANAIAKLVNDIEQARKDVQLLEAALGVPSDSENASEAPEVPKKPEPVQNGTPK